MTSFPKLQGIKPGGHITVDDYERVKSGRKKEEHRILNKMIRKESGLSIEV
jgi:hypothetical protein